jgi:hypothetical protein
MYAGEWPDVVNLVQSVLNNFFSTRLKKRTSMQIVTENSYKIPMVLMLQDNVAVSAPRDFVKAQKLMEVQKL